MVICDSDMASFMRSEIWASFSGFDSLAFSMRESSVPYMSHKWDMPSEMAGKHG